LINTDDKEKAKVDGRQSHEIAIYAAVNTYN